MAGQEKLTAAMDSKEMQVPQNEDGISTDVPVIAMTEKIIAEKEATLRKYIQDNYAKIHAVEKELEALALEVKLTSGSKKAAMELLRRKIEESAEKIKAARTKEQQAKKAWETAQKAVADEEDHKQNLCDDLRTMIQESARQQYEKLESLTKKLDALNPEMRGAALEAIEGLRAKIAPHGPPVLVSGASDGLAAAAEPQGAASKVTSSEGATPPTANGSEGSNSAALEAVGEVKGAVESDKEGGAKETAPRGSGVQLKGQKGRGGLVAGRGGKAKGQGGWTGAGFDVDGV